MYSFMENCNEHVGQTIISIITIARIVVIATILIVISTSNNFFAIFPNIVVIYIAFSKRHSFVTIDISALTAVLHDLV